MLFVRKIVWLALAALAALATGGPASAAIVYLSDQAGNVTEYDSFTGVERVIGSVGPAIPVSQVMGMAYDVDLGRLLLLDRYGSKVIGMDVATGATSVVLSGQYGFQGGAVSGGRLYGILEAEQTVEAYDLATGQAVDLPGGRLSFHAHGLGVDPKSGQLYVAANGNGLIYELGDNGVVEQAAVFKSIITEDVDAFGSDFLSVGPSSTVYRIDGSTGALSPFVTSSYLSSISGIAVGRLSNVPAPYPLGLFALGVLGVGIRRLRLTF
ncbi:hypothetical protein B5C34_00935 [Pacificimonas flava]|uniref:PEP-CTERM protein-sorting domain-containing protein n=2 Tax=Pacificimonas TaxID=1960290 RepID=A0A219B1C0_9SPHN|nr:hypothetical protein B5C34_00935 [Pacificimonas flava]